MNQHNDGDRSPYSRKSYSESPEFLPVVILFIFENKSVATILN